MLHLFEDLQRVVCWRRRFLTWRVNIDTISAVESSWQTHWPAEECEEQMSAVIYRPDGRTDALMAICCCQHPPASLCLLQSLTIWSASLDEERCAVMWGTEPQRGGAAGQTVLDPESYRLYTADRGCEWGPAACGWSCWSPRRPPTPSSHSAQRTTRHTRRNESWSKTVQLLIPLCSVLWSRSRHEHTIMTPNISMLLLEENVRRKLLFQRKNMFFPDAASIFSSFIIPLPVKCPLLDELLIENLFPHVPLTGQ